MPRDLSTLRLTHRRVRHLDIGKLHVRDVVLVQIVLTFLEVASTLHLLGVRHPGTTSAVFCACCVGSLLLHECAHLVTAAVFRAEIVALEVRGILNAGVRRARCRRLPCELAVVSAGPLVTLALLVCGLALATTAHSHGSLAVAWCGVVVNATLLLGCLPGPGVTDGSKLLGLIRESRAAARST